MYKNRTIERAFDEARLADPIFDRLFFAEQILLELEQFDMRMIFLVPARRLFERFAFEGAKAFFEGGFF